MTPTQKIIKDAIAGGYQRGLIGFNKIIEITCDDVIVENPKIETGRSFYGIAWILLDPLAWQAVGKVRGWNNETAYTTLNHDNVPYGDGAEVIFWHRFIDHLADGDDINSALEKL